MCFQGGLYEKWGKDLLFRAKYESSKRQHHRQSHKDTRSSSPSLSATQMQGVFMILALGLSVAVLVFTWEVLYLPNKQQGIALTLSHSGLRNWKGN